MALRDPYAQYVENQIRTATPGKLLVMTYDAAIRFGRIAQERMKERKLDEQNLHIKKMQNILLELISTLKPEVDRQLTDNLEALYTYMFDRLTHANINDDLEALGEVIKIMGELRATWAEAELVVRQNSVPERVAA